MSDIHLADIEPPNSRQPLWKRFKRAEHSTDKSFQVFLQKAVQEIQGPIELVLNGDIFDFDSVMVTPRRDGLKLNWLERRRGMNAAEPKSRTKMSVIIRDHPIFFIALRDFIQAGNEVVFVIGNHDMELHWPSVQEDIKAALNLSPNRASAVRFCEWFYISERDTLIEHGNQYDEYCICADPINPKIRKGKTELVRLPFGNLANKYVLNGMGLFNPHVDSMWIRNSVWEYVVFFYRYQMRVQPFLLFQWFWAALVTFFYSLTETLLPSVKDPLILQKRLDQIAEKSKASVSQVLALRELHVHPVGFQPFRILRELWLDRVIFLTAIVFGSFQIFSFFNVFGSVSVWWFWGPILVLFPVFIFYAHSVESEVAAVLKNLRQTVPDSARIANVARVIHGHTHQELHERIDGVEHINTGTWSPAFEDLECSKPFGRKCFALIAPNATGGRAASLLEWNGQTWLPIKVQRS